MSRNRRRIASRAHLDGVDKRGRHLLARFHLQQRQECHRRRLFTGIVILRALDHADDLEIAAVAAANAETPANRIAGEQEAVEERSGHHGDPPRHRRVVRIEGTASQNLRAERLEITRRDTVQQHGRVFLRFRRIAFDRDSERPAAAVERAVAREACALHARQRAQARIHLLIQRRKPAVFIAGEPRIHVDDEDVLVIEAECLASDVGEAARERDGSSQQDQRKRHFSDDQRLAQAKSAMR